MRNMRFAHNKIMIIDDAIVLTGSFNLTKAAERRTPEISSCCTMEIWSGNTRRTGKLTSRTPSRTPGGERRRST